jgi:SynChlorMet cassette protein ScmD
MKTTETPKANPCIGLREDFEDWAVLFDPNTTNAVGINPVGVAIWKKLDGAHNLNALVAEVRATFCDVPDTVDDEVSAFVDSLAQKGFVAI